MLVMYWFAVALVAVLVLLELDGMLRGRHGRLLWLAPASVGAVALAVGGHCGARVPSFWAWLGVVACVAGLLASAAVWHRVPARFR